MLHCSTTYLFYYMRYKLWHCCMRDRKWVSDMKCILLFAHLFKSLKNLKSYKRALRFARFIFVKTIIHQVHHQSTDFYGQFILHQNDWDRPKCNSCVITAEVWWRCKNNHGLPAIMDGVVLDLQQWQRERGSFASCKSRKYIINVLDRISVLSGTIWGPYCAPCEVEIYNLLGDCWLKQCLEVCLM